MRILTKSWTDSIELQRLNTVISQCEAIVEYRDDTRITAAYRQSQRRLGVKGSTTANDKTFVLAVSTLYAT